MRYAEGGKIEGGDEAPHQPAGILHRAEGWMPHVKGCVIHWQDTGDGIEYEHLTMLGSECTGDTDDN